jgi:hypothetical protein
MNLQNKDVSILYIIVFVYLVPRRPDPDIDFWLYNISFNTYLLMCQVVPLSTVVEVSSPVR